MENKSGYITVVNGLGEKAQIPRAGLEKYKQMMTEAMEKSKAMGISEKDLKCFQIKEIMEE